MIWVTVVMAVRAVRRNALRSLLTMLGVVIGVGAVIAMVTIGNGATAKVQAEVGALGNNMLVILPGARRHGPVRSAATPFEDDDVDTIRREVSGLDALSGTVTPRASVVFGNDNWPSTATGADNDFLKVRGYTLEA